MHIILYTATLSCLWRVAAVRGSTVSAESRLNTSDPIRLYVKYSKTSTLMYTECMPERMNYRMTPNQQIAVEVIFNKNFNFFKATCEFNYRVYEASETREISDYWNVSTIIFPDLGDTSGYVMCLIFSQSNINKFCQVHISIGDEVDENVQYIQSFVNAFLPVTLNQPNTIVNELQFAENTSVTVFCLLNKQYNKPQYNHSLHRLYANGSEVEIVASYTKEDFIIIHTEIYFQKENYNDNIFFCLLQNTVLNQGLRRQLKLRYRDEVRQTADMQSVLLPFVLIMCVPMICMTLVIGGYYFWRQKGKVTATAASGDSVGDPRASTTESNQYEPVYEVIDDEQIGMNQSRIEQQQPSAASGPHSPPPLQIPLAELPQSHPGNHQLPQDSAIAPEDLYLLNLDSDGYEIPDELKFIPLPGGGDVERMIGDSPSAE